jgi:serine protease Do
MLSKTNLSKPFAQLRISLVAALLAGAALGAGGAAWGLSAPTPPPISVAPTNATQSGFAPLVAKVKPAVVQITTTSPVSGNRAMPNFPDFPPGSPFGDFFHQFRQQNNQNQAVTPMQRALGSGFIIDPSGYIVTNNHVVDGARDISVTLSNGDKYRAKLIGRDSKTDLALLKIDAGHDLPYVAFGDSDREQEGDWVIAVGNPYGLGGTVTAGIVSAHGRNINEGPYDDFLQIDAPINPGNSGGPLFNQSGQVIGIDTAIFTPSGGSVGIGFAIPSNVAKDIVAQLRAHGKVARGWLGVQMQPMTESLAKAVGLPNHQGVLVDVVEDDSPAAHAHVQQGDVITAFNGKPIKTTRDLAMAVADTPSGKTVPMTVWRNQHSRDLSVTIGTQNKQQLASANNANANPTPVGMALAPLTPEMRDQLNVGADVGGVVVSRVTPGSKADDSGVQAGDIIQRVAGHPVSSPAEAADQIHAAERQNKPAIPLLVMRNGVSSYLGLQLARG